MASAGERPSGSVFDQVLGLKDLVVARPDRRDIDVGELVARVLEILAPGGLGGLGGEGGLGECLGVRELTIAFSRLVKAFDAFEGRWMYRYLGHDRTPRRPPNVTRHRFAGPTVVVSDSDSSSCQVIENPCDLAFPRRTGGHCNSGYTRHGALEVVKVASKFTDGWSRDGLLRALNYAFEAREGTAECNPFRRLALQSSAASSFVLRVTGACEAPGGNLASMAHRSRARAGACCTTGQGPKHGERSGA